jgi:signal transduction histidine kinase
VYEGEKCFEELTDVMTEPVWVVRPDGKLMYGNRRWHSLTGISEGEDFPGGFIMLLHPEDRQRWIGAWQQALRTRHSYGIERRVRCALDPEYVRQFERAQPVRNSGGDVVAWVLIATTYDENQQLIEGLRRAAARKDEALMAVAHELRSPLAPIASAVELLKHRGSDPRCVADVRALITRQVAQLVRLVEDLLDLGRLEHRQLSVRKDCIDLRCVLAAAVETAQPIITAHEHRLTTTAPTDTAVVHGDEGRLTQVVVNLLVNAAKFTPKGGRIWLSLEKDGSLLFVKVRDTGIGISGDMLPRIFDAYVRAVHGASNRGGGLGLGLALAQQLVRLHDGVLTVHSEGAGKGTEFILQLPVANPR